MGRDGVWIKTSETKPLLETMHYGCEHICSFELAMHSYAIFAFLVTVWRQVISMNNSHGIGSLTVTQSYIRMPQNLNWRTCTVLFVKMVELNRYELGVYQCLNPTLWLETKKHTEMTRLTSLLTLFFCFFVFKRSFFGRRPHLGIPGSHNREKIPITYDHVSRPYLINLRAAVLQTRGCWTRRMPRRCPKIATVIRQLRVL